MAECDRCEVRGIDFSDPRDGATGYVCDCSHKSVPPTPGVYSAPAASTGKVDATPSVSLRAYQNAVDLAIHRQGPGYWPPFIIFARLIEEMGEIGRELNHLHGPKKRKEGEPPGSLGDEIADAIFTLICLANSEKIDLDASLERAIRKCDERDRDRFKPMKKDE